MTTASVPVIVGVAVFATLFWRVIGISVARKLDLDHPLYQLFVHISYASVAAVLLQNLLSSDGRYPPEEMASRVVAALIGLLVCRMRTTRVFAGLVAALVSYSLLSVAGGMEYLLDSL